MFIIASIFFIAYLSNFIFCTLCYLIIYRWFWIFITGHITFLSSISIVNNISTSIQKKDADKLYYICLIFTMNIFIDCFLCFTTLLLPAQRFSFCADFPSVLTCSMLPLTVSIFCLFTLSASHPSPYKTKPPPPYSPPSPGSRAQQSP